MRGKAQSDFFQEYSVTVTDEVKYFIRNEKIPYLFITQVSPSIYSAVSGELFEKIKHKDKFNEISRTKYYQNIKKLRKLIVDKQIDLVHANSLRMVLYSILLQKIMRTKLKIAYTKHNVTILEKRNPTLFRYILNSYVDRIITVSEFEKINLVRIGVKADRITTIYNGVDLRQFTFQKKEKRECFKVGILARLSIEKNHELFIEIANKLEGYFQT